MRTMMTILMTTALLGLMVIPPSAADHGTTGSLVSSEGLITANMKWVAGWGDNQVWEFNWRVVAGPNFSCLAVGNIENGFTAGNGCTVRFSTQGTGHAHTYPNCHTDVHDIEYRFGSLTGKARQTIDSDC